MVAAACTAEASPPTTRTSEPRTVAPLVESPIDRPERPNIVLVLTDDQDVRSVEQMPFVRRVLRGDGLSFARAFATYPLCCPSRASILTGRYAHNHGVLSNRVPDAYAAFDDRRALPVLLGDRGYATAHVGKYLNGYGSTDAKEVPPGWDEWHTTLSGDRYYGWRMNRNGRVVADRDSTRYLTDVLTDAAVRVVREATSGQAPLFLMVSYTAPHAETPRPSDQGGVPDPIPAPRHRGRWDGRPFPRPGGFDEADVSDKPGYVRQHSPLTQHQFDEIERSWRRRAESLLAVDEGVARIVRALRQAGELDDSYLLFTSDNGWLEGQHRLPWSKYVVYEPSVRVPLLVHGPDVQNGAVVHDLVANIDLAPTILDLAGAPAPEGMDGLSLVPALTGGDLPVRDLVLEALDSDNDRGFQYSAVRTRRYVYVEYSTGERELYDLKVDPHQLDSRHDDPEYAAGARRLAARLDALSDCSGAACR